MVGAATSEGLGVVTSEGLGVEGAVRAVTTNVRLMAGSGSRASDKRRLWRTTR